MGNLKAKSVQNSALWAAYGDALGFISELIDEKGLKRRINSSRATATVSWKRNVGGRFGAEVELPAGCYSDDTQLRLATSRAIRGDGFFDVEAFAKIELPVWTSYSLGGGVGTRLAASSLAHPDVTWFSNFFKHEKGRYVQGGGNGAAMRIQPHIWAAREFSAPETFIPDVVRNAICTHGHPRGIFGAVFHALCLAKTIELQHVPGPKFWKEAVDYFPRVIGLIKSDSELNSFWLPIWEQRFGGSIAGLVEQVWTECQTDVAIAEKYASQKSEIAYRQMVENLGCLKSVARGSGTKTAIIAAAVAWMYRDESPAKPMEVAANLLFSDTDTIATMAGAILGVVESSGPPNSVLDHEYIAKEAARLHAISTGNLQVSFSYPDLLQWQAPKTQLDAIGLVSNDMAIAGLGIATPKEKEYRGRSKSDFFWQWFELDYGQSVMCKRRPVLSPLLAGNTPPNLRYSKPPQKIKTEPQQAKPTPQHRVNNGCLKPFEDKVPVPKTIDELTRETINSGGPFKSSSKDGIGASEIGADDFARRFSLRAKNLMWLLGAGASASAGIPTAWDMVWEFKQQLFISQRRISPNTVADLSNQSIRSQLQAYIESSGKFPPSGAPEEYAALFEAVYPAEADRRAYIDAKMNGAKPSFGHLALATLMRERLTRLVWTTNFDPLVADACAKVYGGTGPLTTVGLDAPDLGAQAIVEERWPVEVKLHGDFRSRRLKNTGDELRHQDSRLRQVLLDSCRHFGLVVAGYSGRDNSIMDTLEKAINQSGAFPAGLFWLNRGDRRPLSRVSQLLARAAEAGVEAALVPVENFDETLRDLLRLMSDIDTKVLDDFAAERRRWSGAPIPAGRRGWPVVRLNALSVTETPSVCRRVLCRIGGYGEVREAVAQADVDVLAARTNAGVLAYGSDADVRSAFLAHDITIFDLHTIETKRLQYESGERGLLRAALTHAIARTRGLNAIRSSRTDLFIPADPKHPIWKPLQHLVGALCGTVKENPELRWYEGLGTRLDWADDRLWLLIEPRTVFIGTTASNKAAAAAFARERTIKRYNRQLNDLISFWAALVAGKGDDLRALGIGDGVDATFRLSPSTAFSQRATA